MFCAAHGRKPEGKVNKTSAAHPLSPFLTSGPSPQPRPISDYSSSALW